ncbi:phosphomevalonate kinase [Anabrus simplex]|uniref:phosphomevalonate kinase n=1 Tax=Anabrus simplex TaxID=316456 RepID=UPI0034DD3292
MSSTNELQECKYPVAVLLLSGKRKSGKDYVAERLYQRFGSNESIIVKLSAPIKNHWANTHGLDLAKLLDSTDYKEHYRQDMILWGESMREKDYGYFCRAALDMFNAQDKPIWIVSDTRRKTDLKWFRENFNNKVKTVRVYADENVRKQRGWTFTPGVDDVASECDLDVETDWDWRLVNNGTSEDLEKNIQSIIEWALSQR